MSETPTPKETQPKAENPAKTPRPLPRKKVQVKEKKQEASLVLPPAARKIPRLALTMGDLNGVGPEVILKVLSNELIFKQFTPVIFGAGRAFAYYNKILKLGVSFVQSPPEKPDIEEGRINLINCVDETTSGLVDAGKSTEEGGRLAFLALQQATEALRKGWVDGVVTAPINKQNIQSEGFSFPGHTEFFTSAFDQKESLMFLVDEGLRVGVVTGHVPVNSVSQRITAQAVRQKLDLMLRSLQQDFGLSKPKVAVLGLNPHAGEEGLLGKEEQKTLIPLIESYKEKGHFVFGPFPADGFFGMRQYEKVDAVLAMYHDQGLIPFKTLAMDSGVNFTAGLPIVRTSPDHGTAYDIAGKGVANPESMLQAVFLAVDVLANRRRAQEDAEAKQEAQARKDSLRKGRNKSR